MFPGAALARGRRTVTGRIRAARLDAQFRPCDTAVAAAGKRTDRIARRVLTEAWARGRKEEESVDRSESPWDSSPRRPSHADRRRAWRREHLGEGIRAVLYPGVTQRETQAAAERLLRLAV